MVKNFFEFKLESPISGKIDQLILYSPKNVHRPLTAKLDSMLRSGMLELSKLATQPDESVSTSEQSSNPFDKMSALEIVDMIKMIPSSDYSFLSIFCFCRQIKPCEGQIASKSRDCKVSKAFTT